MERDEEFLKRINFFKAWAVKPAPELEGVPAVVCEVHGLTRTTLIEAGRDRRASDARAYVGLVSQELKAATLTEVAKLTGRVGATGRSPLLDAEGAGALREKKCNNTNLPPLPLDRSRLALGFSPAPCFKPGERTNSTRPIGQNRMSGGGNFIEAPAVSRMRRALDNVGVG